MRGALQCHVTGDDLHTCALICSAVGGLILSHYCRRCQHTTVAHMAARMSVLPLDQAGGVFHQPRPPAQTIKKTKLLSWALAKCAGLSVWVVKEIKRMLYYPPVLCFSFFFFFFFLLLLLWMRKWEGLGNRTGEWDLRWMDFLECAQAKTGVIQSIDLA